MQMPVTDRNLRVGYRVLHWGPHVGKKGVMYEHVCRNACILLYHDEHQAELHLTTRSERTPCICGSGASILLSCSIS
jgi:hypothetical protein